MVLSAVLSKMGKWPRRCLLLGLLIELVLKGSGIIWIKKLDK
jgi:hypothetical protein